ncbi:phage portal protein [Cutibacterium sp. WCA-380-WT-3A]|uniref:Phage portal protein n=1 Tax=Cutibacterium porci TaxID=2605781 RepID=A0A7K0J831_9ACTN|nr:phage portal protein [Cutibacterium porci]MSS45908.1 phage portal protein [Cutibacterium porci]
MGALTRTAERLGLIVRESAPATAGQPMRSIIPDSRPATVTDDLALSLDAVYRAVQVLQTAAGQLTLDVWRGAIQIDPPSWVLSPDPWRPTSTFLEETVASLALRGNAFWQIKRKGSGEIVALTILDPLGVNITVSPAGIPTYRVGSSTLTRRDCAHLALMRRPGARHPLGLGPIQAAQAQIISAVELRRYAGAWMDTSTVPNGVLTSDQLLTADQARTIKDSFLESVKATEPVVLGQGTDYRPLLLKPDEVQWIDAQQLNTIGIARLFGIPPRLILASPDGGTETYSNQQQEELSFVRWTLMAYLRQIEAAVSWLLPRGNTARFNLDAILRPDTLTRYQAHKVALDSGFLTIDEVRRIEGLEPLTQATTQEDANV